MKKALLALLLPLTVSAEDSNWIEMGWNDGQAITRFIEHNQEVGGEPLKMFWAAHISHNQSGKQKMYINHTYLKTSSCSPTGGHEIEIWKFNRQPVKMIVWCKKFSNSNNYFIHSTPQTNAGDKFLMDEFSNESNETIFIEGNQFRRWSINISTEGFIDELNKSGGNAL